MKKCLIIANGKSPKKKIISFLQSRNYNDIICADGGANSARRLGIIPKYIIGDLDSITNPNLRYYQNKSKIVHLQRQNDTDVEKSLKYAIKQGYDDCILLGVIGDRLDHSICNLSIVLKFSDKIRIRIISENSILSVISGEVKLNTFPGEVISIFCFNPAARITTNGLKYELKNCTLPFGEKESESNQAKGNSVQIKVKKGKIILIRSFEVVRKNDFI